MVVFKILCLYCAILCVKSECVTTTNNNTLTYELTTENNTTDITAIKITSVVINVTQDLFENLQNLQYLDIGDNSLKVLKGDCFRNTQKLHTVHLQSNQLVHIPRRVFSRSKMVELNLQWNKISEIDDFAFEDMSALSYLDLSNNFLTKISRTWFKDTAVELLDLRNNRIVQILRKTFSELPGLYFLELSFNRILYIEDQSFAKCNGLGFLSLAGNGLTDTKFLSNTTVEELELSLNKINKIELSDTTTVKEISIYPNPLNCACLNQFWALAKRRNMKIKQPSKATLEWQNTYPVCYAGNEASQICSNNEESTAMNHWLFNAINYEAISKIYKKLK